ncbi:XRE family transcriptional regulator [Petroclostridium sp. X23]|uniref:helix-turn-helix domain-containing protein n=1 Tax=Petroclostridium sp. X23 TaxID=3045146 RepID=UPI0024AD3B65|nr:XRE family transcriptional regulator [Petroclostridium sp. X23]WHH60278.1 XRE family transcriptional regulator [Petroclostridium sp. X23]
MSEQIRLIAQRIKELREISGCSIHELAQEFNISNELYEQYESGNTDIPVSFLYEIANKFNVELSAILTGDAPKLHTYALVRKDKGVGVERRRQYKYQSLAYNFIHKKAEPFLVTVDPSPEDAPISMNTHPGQEFNYLIEGSLKIIINNHEIILNEGDSLYFDSNYKHGMKALNGKPAKFLAIII